jgi:hypothetical protein
MAPSFQEFNKIVLGYATEVPGLAHYVVDAFVAVSSPYFSLVAKLQF